MTNSCKTDLDSSLRRYFGKGVNPYINKEGVFEMQIVENMTEERRRSLYEVISQANLMNLTFHLDEEEAGRRLFDNGWDVKKCLDSIKTKDETYRKYDLTNLDPKGFKNAAKANMFHTFGNDKEGRPIHYVFAKRLVPGK
jgi:hypothetical protein